MANFYLLRTEKVNLLRYLPAFLFNDETLKDLGLTLSWEHEQMRLGVSDQLKNLFVDYASEKSLAKWEEFLGITYSTTASIQYRRGMILQKLRGAETFTLEKAKAIVNQHSSGNVVEDNEHKAFRIYVSTNDPKIIANIKADFDRMRPAHLGYALYGGYSWDGQIDFDGNHQFSTGKQENYNNEQLQLG